MKGGVLFVERLVFPNQIVNGAHVHFKPEDWGTVIANTTDDEFQRINFYWHKHPDGMPGASQGDEDDTFDVFMPEDTERKFFGFMQTCKKSGGGMDYEGRIEMRDPIFASITNVKMVTNEDLKIESECLRIIKKHITDGNEYSGSQPGFKNEEPKVTTPATTVTTEVPKAGIKPLLNELPMIQTKQKDGKIFVTISSFLESVFDTCIESQAGDIIKNMDTTFPKNTDEFVIKVIYPKKKKHAFIVSVIDQLSVDIKAGFNGALEDKVEPNPITTSYDAKWDNDYSREYRL